MQGATLSVLRKGQTVVRTRGGSQNAGFAGHSEREGWRCWWAGPGGRRLYSAVRAALPSSARLLGRAQARTVPIRVRVEQT